MKTRVTHIVSDAYVFFLKGYSLELEHSAHFFKMVISIRVLWSPGLKKKISDKMWQVWAIIEERRSASLFLKFPKIGSNWRFFFNERHLHTPTGKKILLLCLCWLQQHNVCCELKSSRDCIRTVNQSDFSQIWLTSMTKHTCIRRLALFRNTKFNGLPLQTWLVENPWMTFILPFQYFCDMMHDCCKRETSSCQLSSRLPSKPC